MNLKQDNISAIIAVRKPVKPINRPQTKLPFSTAILFTKYTEKIKVVCIVGIGEVPKSKNMNERDFLLNKLFFIKKQNF